ncbi:MAG: hypothetical protein JXA68_07300 [Ignavibacteriales bacterium]|nr:hypothetical protein [Ignavibacteriales bacterium]
MEDYKSKLYKYLFFIFVTAILFFFCLASLYLGMRGIMDLGGFVAYGGPYVIQHEAPGWVWIMPVSIIAGMASVFLNQVFSKRIGGWSIILPVWSLLFISLGENFLEYSFLTVNGQTVIAWGWLICGVLFVLMGGIPIIFINKIWKNYLLKKQSYSTAIQYTMMGRKIISDEDIGWQKGKIKKVLLSVYIISALIGVYLGIEYFIYLSL